MGGSIICWWRGGNLVQTQGVYRSLSDTPQPFRSVDVGVSM